MMEYLDARKTRTHRTVQPLHIRRRNGQLLLVAHCELRGDQRTFKLDRIVQLTKLNPDVPSTPVARPSVVQPFLFDPPVVVTSTEAVGVALEVVEPASVESSHVESVD